MANDALITWRVCCVWNCLNRGDAAESKKSLWQMLYVLLRSSTSMKPVSRYKIWVMYRLAKERICLGWKSKKAVTKFSKQNDSKNSIEVRQLMYVGAFDTLIEMFMFDRRDRMTIQKDWEERYEGDAVKRCLPHKYKHVAKNCFL